MQRNIWWLFLWLLLYLMSNDIICKNSGESEEDENKSKPQDAIKSCKHPLLSQEGDENQKKCQEKKLKRKGVSDVKQCMEYINNLAEKGSRGDVFETVWSLKEFLEEVEVNETMSIYLSHLVALIQKPKGPFKGLQFHSSMIEADVNNTVHSSSVSVQLPRELDMGPDDTIAFCLLTWPDPNRTLADELYGNRLVGLNVRGKNISGLQERINITMVLTEAINETQEPTCVFYNFSQNGYSRDGCLTLWERGQGNITCSCDHLTYFGVLMVSASLSPKDQEILTYISQIGCGLSLFALVAAVIIFITNRAVRADVSMKIHVSLAVALILLNLHFLPSQMVAAQASTGVCIYMALSLHYSLLATFSWMALEGFHIYMLLVRVFNIYVKRYLLKLSLVGWGIPAVILSLVAIIDRGAYGRVALDSSSPNSTFICYIANDTVKVVTTVGAFGLVFVFNVVMFGVTVRRVMSLRLIKEHGQSDRDRAKRDIFTLLGVTVLLGITWGPVFFSFGYLTVPGLYIFCILNSLQGVFIFLWFAMSLKKNRNSATVTSSVTGSTNS